MTRITNQIPSMARTGNNLLIFLGLLLLGISVAVHFYTGYYGDKQWEMLYAEMWLGGKALYKDIFPVSPPLIFWMYGLPAALSHLPYCPDDFTMLVLLGLSLISACIFLCWLLMTRHPGFKERCEHKAELAALLCFVLIFRTSPIYFLDREHLFFVLILPYLLLFSPALRHEPAALWLRVTCALIAGLGFCIKPYCLIVWLGIQVLYTLAERSPWVALRLENIIIYAMGFGYLLLVWRLTPEYFSLTMPMALATYSATRDPTPVFDYSANAIYILAPTFLMFKPRHTSPWRRDIYYLAGLCPFFLFYALLNNNWAYTYYPLSSTALIVTGYVLWEFLYLRRSHAAQSLPTWTFIAGLAACLVTFAVRLVISLNYFYMVANDPCHHNPVCGGDDALMAEVRSDAGTASFGAVTIDFTRWTRLVDYTHAPWKTRFPQLWMLPKFLLSDKEFTKEHQWILDYVAEAYAQDMNRNRPEVLFVDDTDVFYTALLQVDLVAYFSANAHFAQAMRHYRFTHVIDLCGKPHSGQFVYKMKCSYRVYRLIPNKTF